MFKYLICLLFLIFSLNSYGQIKVKKQPYVNPNEIRGDEPWKTFDKKNVGGTLISVGWTVTVVTFLAAPPTTTSKVIAYGVGGSITTSGVLYWIIKGHKYKKKPNGFKI
jgi:hypothetical protein